MADFREQDRLYHCVILAAGWRKKLLLFNSGKDAVTPADIPPEHLHDPRAFLAEQESLMNHTVQALIRRLDALDRHIQTSLARALRQRHKTAKQLDLSRLSPDKANAESERLNETTDRLHREQTQCGHLLRWLHENPEIPLPSLPLPRYAETIRAQFPELLPESKASAVQATFRKISGPFVIFWRQRDASDRIALVTASFLCLFVLGFGAYYLFLWDRILVEVHPASSASYRILFQNISRSPVLLHVPFLSHAGADHDLATYGLNLELQAQGQPSYTPFHSVTGWTYKDAPAHLAGPIVVSPGLPVEIHLNLLGAPLPPHLRSLRLVCLRAPNRPIAHFSLALPPASR